MSTDNSEKKGGRVEPEQAAADRSGQSNPLQDPTPVRTQAPVSVLALILEALSTGIRTKPVKYVSTIAVCLLVIGFVIWTAVVAWIDLKNRLHASERQLETVSAKADKIEEIGVKAAEVDTIKAATEDASLIQNTRVDLLEAEMEVIRKDLEIAEKRDRGEPTLIETVAKTSTKAKAALIESARRKPASDAVLDDGVIDYERAESAAQTKK